MIFSVYVGGLSLSKRSLLGCVNMEIEAKNGSPSFHVLQDLDGRRREEAKSVHYIEKQWFYLVDTFWRGE